MEEGIKCPKCGSGNNSIVLDSRPRTKQTYRRRQCINCDTRFTTTEQLKNEMANFDKNGYCLYLPPIGEDNILGSEPKMALIHNGSVLLLAPLTEKIVQCLQPLNTIPFKGTGLPFMNKEE